MKWVLRTMAWMPEIMGASRENHVMRSSAVVNSMVYGDGGIQLLHVRCAAATP